LQGLKEASLPERGSIVEMEGLGEGSYAVTTTDGEIRQVARSDLGTGWSLVVTVTKKRSVEVTIRSIGCGLELRVAPDTRIATIKQIISERLSIAVSEQVLKVYL